MRKAGNRLRITAQLVNVADGYQLWSERYDREIEDVFAIQDEIAGNIVKALRVVLSEDEKRAIEKAPHRERRGVRVLPARPPVLPPVPPRTGIEYRPADVQAGDRDRSEIRARLRRHRRLLLVPLHVLRRERGQSRAARTPRAAKALELEPELAEAHASRGFALSLKPRTTTRREREFERAMRLESRSCTRAIYFYARSCMQEGKSSEAARHFERGRRRCAPRIIRRCYSLRSVATPGSAHDDVKTALQQGMQRLDKHLELNPDDTRALYLGAGALMQQGQRDKAVEWAGRRAALDPEDSGVLYNVACVYAVGGGPSARLISWSTGSRAVSATRNGSSTIPISCPCTPTPGTRRCSGVSDPLRSRSPPTRSFTPLSPSRLQAILAKI